MSDTALIVIDVQNDFCPGGHLAVAGGDEVVPVINAMAPDFEHLILTQDAGTFTGRFCIDDTLLYEHGVRDFEKYRVDPSLELAPDFFVPDSIPPPPGVSLGTRIR